MNLMDMISELARALELPKSETEGVEKDLSDAIALRFMIQLSEAGKDVEEIVMAIESKDKDRIIAALELYETDPEKQPFLEEATVSVISDWVDSIIPGLSEEQQDKLADVLSNLGTTD